jgi:hypothetical protein
LKKYEEWFDEACSKLLDQRKQAKLQWLQDPCKIKVDNLNNIKPAGISGMKSRKSERQK